METRWKRILAIVLTVTLFVTMTGVPTCIITGDRVYAAESGNIPDVCEQAAYQEPQAKETKSTEPEEPQWIEVNDRNALYSAIERANGGEDVYVRLTADIDEQLDKALIAGSLTLDTGEYTLSGYPTSDSTGFIHVAGGTFTLAGGTVTNDYTVMSSGMGYAICVTSGNVIINDGTVSCKRKSAIQASGGTVTINGGAVQGGTYGNAGVEVPSNSSVDVTITSGSITGKRYGIYFGSNSSGSVTIKGGTFAGSSSGLYVYNTNVTAKLSGGTFTGEYMAVQSNVSVSALLDKTEQPTTYYVYFAEDGKPVALEEGQTERLPGGTYTVGVCNHPGILNNNGDGTHSGDCPYCGTDIEAEPHTWNVDGSCICGEQAVAVMEKDGISTYITADNFASAFGRDNSGATVTMLDDVETTTYTGIYNSFILDLNGHKITSSKTALNVGMDGNLTVRDSSEGKTGQVISTQNYAAVSGDGTLTLEGGTFISEADNYAGVHIMGDSATLSVTSQDVNIQKLSVNYTNSTKVSLSAGTYTGNPAIAVYNSNATLGDPLTNYGEKTDTHYAYFDEDGNPIVDILTGTELTGSVTVDVCNHDAEAVKQYQHNESTETHTMTCLACGYTEAMVDCDYGTEYKYDETNHTQTCMLCGYEKVEAHTINKITADVTDNVITVSEKCETCGYSDGTTLGTVTLHIPEELTYGATQDKAVTWETSLSLFDNMLGISMDNGYEQLYQESYPLPELTAGEHTLEVIVNLTVDIRNPKYAMCVIPLIVAPAPLTGEMVTLSTESATYNGTEQKPTITVYQGDKTLDEDTDYTVSYDRSDFTNAGTYTITITGKGNYTGTVEKTYTIAQAEMTIKANDQNIIYGESIAQGADNVTVAGLCSGDSLDDITLTAGTTNVPGGDITPSAAGIKNSSDGDVTGNYAITYEAGNLTIGKAEGTLAVPETSINKNFGDEEFSLNCSTNGDGKISYTSDKENVAAVSADGTVLIKGVGETTITVSLAEGSNYTGADNQTVTISVAKGVLPDINPETKDYIYTIGSNGDVNIDVAGKLPDDRGTTTYSLNISDDDSILSGVSVDENGNLTYAVEENMTVGSTADITVTAKMDNYEDTSFTININIVEKIPVELKSGSSISIKDSSILTYGQQLSDLKLNPVVFVEPGTDNQVEGTLSWQIPDEIPEVSAVTAVWVFTPKDSNKYVGLTGTIKITVKKAAKPQNTPSDTMSAANHYTKVDDVLLPEGWEWQETDRAVELEVGTPVTADALYNGEDKGNYETESVTITITRSSCDHINTEIRDVVAAACQSEGYSGDTYCKDCGAKTASGMAIPVLGHDYSGKITKEATKEEEGVYTYTCNHCGDTYTKSIPKLPGTASGNTSNQEDKIPVEGEMISDAKSKAVYTVTQAGKAGGTVSYTKSADNKATSISVPNTVILNGISYKVTSIAQNAFKNNKKLTKVTIGNNITAIGSNAFYGCKKLKNVSMGTNVTTIGTKAFYKCTSLTKITIPAKVSRIGKQAFYGCKKLKTITIKTKKLTSKKVGSKAFKGIHSKATVKVPKSKLKIYKKMLKAKGIGSKVKVKK